MSDQTPANTDIDSVPAWLQTRAGSELDRLIHVVRLAPGQPTGFLHSNYDAAGLIWRWALKWFQPKTSVSRKPEQE